MATTEFIESNIQFISINSLNLRENALGQRSPTFLAPGTSFMEDNFSADGGRGDGSGGNASDGEQWERWGG